ncbi:MAG: acetyl-CoA decarbonylase/synthase complex subunit gamma [Methanospirillaceae archaeon]|nr:acetyl-CoA decarbonylase/synthase complex subunit gamma [Methanospirillaceae archaeon]
MALKPLEIYKLLPKKNCKECGEQTCLSFAMKLAQGKADPASCPYLDSEAKAALSSQTGAPIAKITIGMGSRMITIGEETVFYRHDKTFYHEPAIIYRVVDTAPAEEITALAARIREEKITRIGIDLQVNGLAVDLGSGSLKQSVTAVTTANEGGDIPLVLQSEDPEILKACLAVCGNYNPLICAATEHNYRELCDLAKKYDAPLVVRAPDVEKIGALSKECMGLGIKKIVLDITGADSGEYLSRATLVRSLALTRTAPELGFPILLDCSGSVPDNIVTGIVKFASVLITPQLPVAEMTTALVLRQNIYTDPQKPIQMTPGLYRIGDPGPDSPVFMTVNFSLTFFTLQGYLEAARVPCFLLIVETEGMSVLTSVAAGKLNESVVAEWITKTSLADEVNEKKLIIPGYASPLSGRIEDATGWKVVVGPRDAADIGRFLTEEWK